MIIIFVMIIGVGIAAGAVMLFLSRRHKKKHADDGKGKVGYVILRILALLCFIPALFVLAAMASAFIIDNFG